MYKMDYHAFKDFIVQNFEGLLPPEYWGGQVMFWTAVKNNCTEEKLVYRLPDQKMTPAIDIQDFFNTCHADWENIDAAAQRLADMYVVAVKKIEDRGNIIDVCKRAPIRASVVGISNNQKLLSDTPHKEFLDLALIPYFDMGDASVRISYGVMEAMGYTERRVLSAMENSLLFDRMVLKKVNDILGESGILQKDNGVKKDGLSDLLVLTNERYMQGASLLTRGEAMELTAERLQSDFLIIPSSTNELIIMADNGDFSPEELLLLKKSIDEIQVEKKIRLPNSLYRYSTHEKKIEICASDQERLIGLSLNMEKRERKKQL